MISIDKNGIVTIRTRMEFVELPEDKAAVFEFIKEASSQIEDMSNDAKHGMGIIMDLLSCMELSEKDNRKVRGLLISE